MKGWPGRERKEVGDGIFFLPPLTSSFTVGVLCSKAV